MPAPTFEKDARTEPPRRFRFTLRTMFVVVTMVAVTVALFLRYRHVGMHDLARRYEEYQPRPDMQALAI